VSTNHKHVVRLSSEEKGQAISEYAITLGVLLVLAPIALRLLDISISQMFHLIANQIH
jgi:hypothetical protein